MVHKCVFDYVPEIYRGFFPLFFRLPIAPERHATCDRCAMAGDGVTPSYPGTVHYSSRVKCCTFHPTVPNYLVGALLEDTSPGSEVGRNRMRGSIRRRIGVTPRGVGPSAKYRVLYRFGVSSFGRAQSMVCPFYSDGAGNCSVWMYRTAQCSAYFCKFNHGYDGWRFWDALSEYLQHVEWALASHAMHQLGWHAEAILTQDSSSPMLEAEDLDELPPDADAYAATWRDWAGREEELYRSSYEVVRGLDLEAFRQICGIKHSLQLMRLQDRYTRMLSPEVPEVLIRNPRMEVHPAGGGSMLLQSSIPSDPRLVRKEVYTLLDLFDGTRSWRDVIASCQEKGTTTLNEGLVVALYQHRVLVDASPRFRAV